VRARGELLSARPGTPPHATAVGGATNHRLGLDAAVLVKENHARLAGGSETCLVDARVNLTAVSPAVFAAVRRGCLEGCGVTICYASMTTPTPTDRLIFPHSLVHAGRRWHG